LHGEPTWSFAYRKLVRAFTPHRRVVAADFTGFGRSDKPAELGDHTLQLHVDTVVSLVEALDLCRTTLVVHDWGGHRRHGSPAEPGVGPAIGQPHQ
jgi:pimeloyl-ACP methyl ester carboxylesterase